jgi:hypothetical protein
MRANDVTVAEMTALQLKTLVQGAVKEALQEVFDESETELELRPEFEEQLRQRTEDVASGGQLLSMEDLTGRLKDINDV